MLVAEERGRLRCVRGVAVSTIARKLNSQAVASEKTEN
jgi:hypothetical protein